MSEGGGQRDEFDSVLRGLAAEGETPPSLTGSQIRRRGEARGRRRRVAASAAVTMLLVGGAAVAAPRLLGEGQPPAAAVEATATKPADLPSATKPADLPSATTSPKPGPTTSARPRATTTPEAGVATSAEPGGGSGNTAGGSGGDGDSTTIVACPEDDLSFSATNQDGKGEPVRHLLITVTNTGDKKCNIYHHPYIKIGDAQAPAPVIEDSDPKALATLAPGEQAHAALLVSGGRMDEYEAKTLTLELQGRTPGSKASKPINIDLPGVDTLFADDGQRFTYWMTASGLALRFIMSL